MFTVPTFWLLIFNSWFLGIFYIGVSELVQWVNWTETVLEFFHFGDASGRSSLNVGCFFLTIIVAQVELLGLPANDEAQRVLESLHVSPRLEKSERYNNFDR